MSVGEEIRPGLQGWFSDEPAKDGKSRLEFMESSDLIWRDAWKEQIIDVRDEIHPCFWNSYDQREANPIEVVSTHRSKSTELPVYHILGDNAVEVWMRGNYYDWKVSVRSPMRVPDVFFRLFNRDDIWPGRSAVYFEGFNEEWVFGTYAENQHEFSLSLPYRTTWLFAFCFMLTEGVRREVEQA